MVDSQSIPPHDFAIKQLQDTCESLCRDFGFSTVSPLAINKLAAVFRSKICEYAEDTRLFMESTGRTKPIVNDVLATLKRRRVDLEDLKVFARQAKFERLHALPVFPVPDADIFESDDAFYNAMYGPKPSDRELETRPDHVPSYHRATHPNWIPKKNPAEDVSIRKQKDVPKRHQKYEELPNFEDMDYIQLGFGSPDSPPKINPYLQKSTPQGRGSSSKMVVDSSFDLDSSLDSSRDSSHVEPKSVRSSKRVPRPSTSSYSESSNPYSRPRYSPSVSSRRKANVGSAGPGPSPGPATKTFKPRRPLPKVLPPPPPPPKETVPEKINAQQRYESYNIKKEQKKPEKVAHQRNLSEEIRDQMLRAKSQMVIPNTEQPSTSSAPQDSHYMEESLAFDVPEPAYEVEIEADNTDAPLDLTTDLTDDGEQEKKSKKEKRDKNSEEYKEYKRQKKERRRKEREEREAAGDGKKMEEEDQMTSSQNTPVTAFTPSLKVKLKIKFGDLNFSRPETETSPMPPELNTSYTIVPKENDNPSTSSSTPASSRPPLLKLRLKRVLVEQNEQLVNAAPPPDDDDGTAWFCPVCSLAYKQGENMIGCDKCQEWFHWNCVGLKAEPKKSKWFCSECAKDNKKRSSAGGGTHDLGSSAKKRK